MSGLTGYRVGVLAADGTEQIEITAPRDALVRAGATVRVLAPRGEDVRGYHYLEPGDVVRVDGALEDADAEGLDALVVPGGLGGPDTLRKIPEAVALVRSAFGSGRPVGVICHGPWLLLDAGVLAGRTLTCVPQLATEVGGGGATYVDEDVHVDAAANLLVSGRDHDAAEQFAAALVRELAAARAA